MKKEERRENANENVGGESHQCEGRNVQEIYV